MRRFVPIDDPTVQDIAVVLPEPMRRSGRPSRSRRVSRRKDAIAALLVATVLLAMLTAGGTQPLVWALIAATMGAAGLVAAVGIPAGRKPADRGVTALLLTGVLICGFGLLQAGLAFAPLAMQSVAPVGRNLMLRPGSLSPDATLLAVLRGGAEIMFLWLMLCVATNRVRARRIAMALFIGIVGQAIWALVLLGPLGQGHASAYPGAAVGTVAGRNALATFLGMGFVLGLTLLPRRADAKSALWIGLALIGIALLATQSRMGLTATAITTIGVLVHRRPGRHATIALLLTAAAGLLLFGQGVAERAVWLASASEARLALYAQVWQLIMARPLTGFGLDCFPLAFELVHHPPVLAGVVWDRAHSTYLTLWAEAGLLAGSLPLFAGGLAMVMLYRRRAARPAVAAMAALVLTGLHSLVDFSLEIPANLFLLLALVGLGLGASTRQRKS